MDVGVMEATCSCYRVYEFGWGLNIRLPEAHSSILYEGTFELLLPWSGEVVRVWSKGATRRGSRARLLPASNMSSGVGRRVIKPMAVYYLSLYAPADARAILYSVHWEGPGLALRSALKGRT